MDISRIINSVGSHISPPSTQQSRQGRVLTQSQSRLTFDRKFNPLGGNRPKPQGPPLSSPTPANYLNSINDDSKSKETKTSDENTATFTKDTVTVKRPILLSVKQNIVRRGIKVFDTKREDFKENLSSLQHEQIRYISNEIGYPIVEDNRHESMLDHEHVLVNSQVKNLISEGKKLVGLGKELERKRDELNTELARPRKKIS